MLEKDELGVPRYVADRQTIEEPVTSWNIGIMQRFVSDGKVVKVKKVSGIIKRLDAMMGGGRQFRLSIGDTVYRRMMDGDLVLFNRQPTIRMESFLAFRAKIISGHAARLNECWTNAFNAGACPLPNSFHSL